MATPFEQVGGQPAVDALIELFYTYMLSDEKTKGFFRGVNMDNLKTLQKQWWAVQTGATGVTYTGRDMHTSHIGMNISAELYEYIKVNILQRAARELGVPENLVEALGGIWEREAGGIVGA